MCCAFYLHGLKPTRQRRLQPQARKRQRDGSRARLAGGSGTQSRPRGPAARQPGSSTRPPASAVLPLHLPGPVFCPPGSQGLLHFQHHTRPVPEIGREEDRSQFLLNWETATAGLVKKPFNPHLRTCLLISERREGREREGERNIDVREKYRRVASCTCPHWGPNPQTRHVP